jgi:UDP-glucose 4-epimerase
MNASVLVTGAAGFVGVNVVRCLAAQGTAVTALVREQPDTTVERYLAPYRQLIRFEIGDVRDRAAMAALVRDHAPQAVIHAAAVTSAQAELNDPAGFLDVNLGGTLNLLEAARLAGCRRFVLVSSTGLYGAPALPDLPVDESSTLQISGLYTIAKQAGEQLCARYRELYGLSAVAGRLSTAYGPMERPTDSRNAMSPVHQLMTAARAGTPLRIAGAHRRRDTVYIDDAAELLTRLALADRLQYDVYNVAAGEAPTTAELAAAIARLVGGWQWTAVADGDDAQMTIRPSSERAAPSMRRAAQDLCFTPRFPYAAGLQAALAWFNDQPTVLE